MSQTEGQDRFPAEGSGGRHFVDRYAKTDEKQSICYEKSNAVVPLEKVKTVDKFSEPVTIKLQYIVAHYFNSERGL